MSKVFGVEINARETLSTTCRWSVRPHCSCQQSQDGSGEGAILPSVPADLGSLGGIGDLAAVDNRDGQTGFSAAKS